VFHMAGSLFASSIEVQWVRCMLR